MANRQRQDRIESRSEIFAISYVSTAFSFFFFSPPLSAFWKRKRKRKGRRKREGKRKRNGKLEMANRQRRDRIESRKYLLFLTCPQFLPLFFSPFLSAFWKRKGEREREREREGGRPKWRTGRDGSFLFFFLPFLSAFWKRKRGKERRRERPKQRTGRDRIEQNRENTCYFLRVHSFFLFFFFSPFLSAF